MTSTCIHSEQKWKSLQTRRAEARNQSGNETDNYISVDDDTESGNEADTTTKLGKRKRSQSFKKLVRVCNVDINEIRQQPETLMQLSKQVWDWMKEKNVATDIEYDNTSPIYTNPFPTPLVRASGKGSKSCVVKVTKDDGTPKALKISYLMSKYIRENMRCSIESANLDLCGESITMKIEPHPNIVRVDETMLLTDTSLVLMPYIDKTLQDVMKKSDIFPDRACKFMVCINEALKFLHVKYLIFHMDVHEENLLVDEKDEVKLCDFEYSAFKPQLSDWGLEELQKAASQDFDCQFDVYKRIGKVTKYDVEQHQTIKSFFEHDLKTLDKMITEFYREDNTSLDSITSKISTLHARTNELLK